MTHPLAQPPNHSTVNQPHSPRPSSPRPRVSHNGASTPFLARQSFNRHATKLAALRLNVDGADSHLDPGEVRRSAESILSSPEFRGFRRLVRDGEGSADGRTSSRQFSDDDGRAGNQGDRSQPDASDRQSSEASRGPQLLGGAVSSVIGFFFSIVAWAVVAVICGIIVYLVAKALLNYERPRREQPEQGLRPPEDDDEAQQARAPGELPADVYVTSAKNLAREGKYREAIAQLLLGAMSHIERAGLVQYRHGLTHRDYLRAAREREAFYRAMRGMIRVYEPIGFGRRNATNQHFQTTLADYESGFHPSSAPLEG